MEKDPKTFGDDVETLGTDIDLPLVTRIGAIHSRSARIVTWHCHQGCELVFLLSGAAAYEFRQHQTLEVLGGHFLVVPAGVEHRGVHDVRMPSTICGLLLDPDRCGGWRNTPLTKAELPWISRHLAQSGPVVCPFSLDLRGVLERLMNAQDAFVGSRHSCLAKASLRLWACAAILGSVCELTTPHPPISNKLVLAAQGYLKRHLDEPIHIPDLVKHIGLGQSRLFHLFKSATGLTPTDYLLRLRIERAKELLARPAQSVTEIALATGFSSGQYFSDVFRKYAGQTPREYRQEACQRS